MFDFRGSWLHSRTGEFLSFFHGGPIKFSQAVVASVAILDREGQKLHFA